MDWVPGLTWGWLGPSGSLCNEPRTNEMANLGTLLADQGRLLVPSVTKAQHVNESRVLHWVDSGSGGPIATNRKQLKGHTIRKCNGCKGDNRDGCSRTSYACCLTAATVYSPCSHPGAMEPPTAIMLWCTATSMLQCAAVIVCEPHQPCCQRSNAV
jgi:hypothetical protein